MLKSEKRKYYQVREGQTIYDIAAAFCVSPYKLAEENHLTEPLQTGQIVRIPDACGNVYTVKVGENKRQLCGSEERYREQNGTDVFYPGMRIIL